MKSIFKLYIILLFIFLSCSKDKEIQPQEQIQPTYWKKYIGNYNVYDTLGNFIYEINISHMQSQAIDGYQPIDSLAIFNFADTFDLKFQFTPSFAGSNHTKEILQIGFHDSIVDYNNKAWFLGYLWVDKSLDIFIKENSLINDTLMFYFEMDNIKHYINENQPYFRCECKHVAVKQ